jgi:hypothetical protein
MGNPGDPCCERAIQASVVVAMNKPDPLGSNQAYDLVGPVTHFGKPPVPAKRIPHISELGFQNNDLRPELLKRLAQTSLTWKHDNGVKACWIEMTDDSEKVYLPSAKRIRMARNEQDICGIRFHLYLC